MSAAANFTGRPATRSRKGLTYAYRDRKQKKRNFRALWIARINALVREHGMSYSRFIDGLKKAGVELDRKQLAALAMERDQLFGELVRHGQEARWAQPKPQPRKRPAALRGARRDHVARVHMVFCLTVGLDDRVAVAARPTRESTARIRT